MLGVNLRFRPRTYRPRPAIKTVLLVTLVCAGIAGSGTHAAEPPNPASSEAPMGAKFLALAEGERFWFYEGAFRVLGHAAALADKKKGDCVANFYLTDRKNKRVLIEQEIARRPDLGETTIIILLLEAACGRPLIPKALTTR